MYWTLAKIGAKIALNACLPGLGSAIDFAEAGRCFYDGNVIGGLISGASGCANLVTLGLMGATKEAMKESAKGAVVQSAKDTAKSAAKAASKKVGQDLAKQLAMGATKGGKDAAVKMAKALAESASKEATREVGQAVAKELAKGVTTNAVEHVIHEGTKMTVNNLLQSAGLAAVSSGGRQVSKTILEDLLEKLISEALKQNPKQIAFELTKKAAKKGAEEEFKKHALKVLANLVGVSALKGIFNLFSGSTAEIQNKITDAVESGVIAAYVEQTALVVDEDDFLLLVYQIYIESIYIAN